MKKITTTICLCLSICTASAQQMLSLDSCRAMALRNNKQLTVSRLQRDVAIDTRKAARTNYLPKVDAMGGYMYTSKEVSILSDHQKELFSQFGTALTSQAGGNLSQAISQLASSGAISAQTARDLGTLFNALSPALANAGNAVGQAINDAFHTDTRHVWAGSVVVKQPIYMGGAVTAANKMADINVKLKNNNIEATRQNTLYNIDQTYWLVVSLNQKKQLAESYCSLIKKLNADVHKMIDEGVATRADGLRVDVRENEAEMALTQVTNGLALSRMLLCQLCGISLDTPIVLADENNADFGQSELISTAPDHISTENRPELLMLQNAVDISKQLTRITRATYLPHVALTGGYLVSNPNVFNSFNRKFSGVWNVGVMVQVPVWNWMEGKYKVRAKKTATTIASLELADIKEKIDLQVAQSRFKLNEAQKKLSMAIKNVENAEENLRCANVGFREGVMESTDVLTAQTAWQAAKTQKIDAEIDVKLSQVGLKKALGTL